MSNEKIVGALNTILTGSNTTVTLTNGSDVTIFVCNGKTLPKLLSFGARVSEDLDLSLHDPDGIKDRLLSKVKDVSFLLKLISNYAKDIFELMKEMSSLETVDAVSDLPIDDLLRVLIAIVSVNSDFFMTRVMPLLPREL